MVISSFVVFRDRNGNHITCLQHSAAIVITWNAISILLEIYYVSGDVVKVLSVHLRKCTSAGSPWWASWPCCTSSPGSDTDSGPPSDARSPYGTASEPRSNSSPVLASSPCYPRCFAWAASSLSPTVPSLFPLWPAKQRDQDGDTGRKYSIWWTIKTTWKQNITLLRNDPGIIVYATFYSIDR